VSQTRSRTPTKVEQLAQFACGAGFQDLSDEAREQLKLRVLDSLGCALGALGADVPEMVREQVLELGGAPLATLIGLRARSAPDRAALYNGALVRYLDFNDSFLSRRRPHAAVRARGRLPGADPALGAGAGAREGL